MGRPSKLNAEHRARVIELAAKGWSSERIAKHLKGRGVTIAASSIRDIVRAESRTVAATKRADARANLAATTATADGPYERLERNIVRLERLIKIADEKGDAGGVVRLVEGLRKTIDSQTKIAAEAAGEDEMMSSLADLVGLAAEQTAEERAEWVRREIEAIAAAPATERDAVRAILEPAVRALGL